MMKDLETLRGELDQIDRDIVRLFEQRMEVSRGVADYKLARGMQVLDVSREQKVLDSRAALVQDPYWGDSVRSLYEEIMRLSRAEQAKRIAEAEKA